MNWRLTLLALVVCVATVLAVSYVLRDGHTVGTTRSAAIVRQRAPTRAGRSQMDQRSSRSSLTPSTHYSPTSTTGSEPTRKPSKTMPPATASSPRQELPLRGMTVSVDPGHDGGNFTHPEEIAQSVSAGANGTTKACNTTGTETNDGSLTEAKFNWDVAQDLAPRLEHLGATVVLTRHSNDGVGPCVDKRAEIANHAHAAVAVSIHADGNNSAGAHGFDVIHASTEEMVAPRMAGPSLKLADDVRNALAGAGVPPANYVGDGGLDARSDLAGLNLARVPAVLVELGNMRDAEEAAKLEDPAYRRVLADALTAGIVAFLRHP